MKKFKYSKMANDKQIALGDRFGLALEGCTATFAYARIIEEVDKEFFEVDAIAGATEKQINLASKFGHDIRGLSRRLSEVFISDLMFELNMKTIEIEELQPGVKVVNIYDEFPEDYEISSIKEDGTCYFKGGNGQRAWARSLRRQKESIK